MAKSKRDQIQDLLDILTPAQVDIFSKCFGTVKASELKRGELKNALRLCKATAVRNSHPDHILDVLSARHAAEE